jgi:carbamoyl-phosphate synthase large subunit
MAIGRTFKEALMKAWRSLETGKKTGAEGLEPRRLTQMLVTPQPERLGYIRYAFERGMSVREVARLTGMDPWFLHQIREITLEQMAIAKPLRDIDAEQLRQLKRLGLSDERIATEWKLEGHAGIQQVRELREGKGIKPVFKLVDTCAAEFESMTPYLYSTYDEEDEAPPTDTPKIIILGSGPTASARASSSTTAAATRPSRSRKTATRPSWSTATLRPSPPTTTPATGSTLSR